MLRRADNVRVEYRPSWFKTMTRPYFLCVGRIKHPLGSVTSSDFEEIRVLQLDSPVLLTQLNDRNYWWFKDKFY
jgi:hypothetical protein